MVIKKELHVKRVLLKVNIDSSYNACENYFQKQYKLKVHKEFLENKQAKRHNINSHSNWMNDKIKINHMSDRSENINKWKIVKVDFGMNIGTEINGIRPAIIYKASSLKYGEDITVLPITSYKSGMTKAIDTLDVHIQKNKNNGLANNSLIKVRQLKSVSKKRFRRNKRSKNVDIIGEIKDSTMRKKINSQVMKMFGLRDGEK